MSDQHFEDRDTRVARRAYEKWEAEGRPAGRHDAHWHDAAVEIDSDSPAPEEPKAKRAPKKAPASAAEAKPPRTRKPKSPTA